MMSIIHDYTVPSVAQLRIQQAYMVKLAAEQSQQSQTIKHPTTFKIERYNVTTMERLTNASMVGDLIAKKLKFYFTYDAISAEDFDAILSAIYDTDKLFFTLQYPDRGTSKQADVYVGSIPADLHFMSTRNAVWKNVSFNLIER